MKKSITGPIIQGSSFLAEAGHVIDKGFDFYVYGISQMVAGIIFFSILGTLTGVVWPSGLKQSVSIWLKSEKQTENNFIGVNSGIMDRCYWYEEADQRAIYLDTNTLGMIWYHLI